MKRINAALVILLTLFAAILGLDIVVALLPLILPDVAASERDKITEVLSDHSAQLLGLLMTIGGVAVAMRQNGKKFFDDDSKEGDE
jgi:hypothetical protein